MRLPGAEVLIATRSPGKVKEFETLLQPKGLQVRSLRDYPEIPDIVEDGDSFAANAWIKARTIAQRFGVPVIADDSGLCVDRLQGAPGVYSARYAGEHGNDAANNRKLLTELAKLEPVVVSAPEEPAALSPARFVCAIALAGAGGEPLAQVEGTCEGVVIGEQRGEQGFGYDPLFYIPRLGKTMAELTMEEKNAVSHRGEALKKLWKAIEGLD